MCVYNMNGLKYTWTTKKIINPNIVTFHHNTSRFSRYFFNFSQSELDTTDYSHAIPNPYQTSTSQKSGIYQDVTGPMSIVGFRIYGLAKASVSGVQVGVDV